MQKTAETDGQKLLELLDKDLAKHALNETSSQLHQTGLGIYIFDIEHEPKQLAEFNDQARHLSKFTAWLIGMSSDALNLDIFNFNLSFETRRG